MSTQSMNFKDLIKKKKPFILVGVTEPIEALMLKAAGFKAGTRSKSFSYFGCFTDPE